MIASDDRTCVCSMTRYISDGTGDAVLFIQGVGVGAEGWRPQLDGLCDRFKVIAFDNRGIDGAVIDPRTFSVESMAVDAVAVMDAAGVDRCHVVGHSMGGLIAQELALAVPERVSSLSLLCTFKSGRQATRLTPDVLWRGLRTRVGTRRMRRHAFVDLIMPASVLATRDLDDLARELSSLFGRDLADQPPIVMKQLRAMGRFDASPRLAMLASIPTLVVSASEDHLALPAFGRALTRAIPGARFIEVADAGHALPIQRSAQTNELLAAHFLAA
jgi:pimeloyl-ACP methyl ester carboxylesterase